MPDGSVPRLIALIVLVRTFSVFLIDGNRLFLRQQDKASRNGC